MREIVRKRLAAAFPVQTIKEIVNSAYEQAVKDSIMVSEEKPEFEILEIPTYMVIFESPIGEHVEAKLIEYLEISGFNAVKEGQQTLKIWYD